MKIGQQKINDVYSSKKVLITGQRGYLGSMLRVALQNLGCDIKTFGGDVSVKEDWSSNLDKVDIVFHLAAIEYDATKDPYRDLNTNAVSVLHLFESCKLKSISPKVIFASSSNIFSRAKSLPITENEKDSPASIWSAHKLLAENYLNVYSDQLGATSSSLRLSNVYGPSTTTELSKRTALNKMIDRALSNRKIKLFNNCQCIRDWVYIEDVVDAFLLAGTIEDKKFHNFLIGSESENTIAQTAQIIIDEVENNLGKNVKIDYGKDTKLPAMAMRNYAPNCELFKSTTGWYPKYDLKNGIKLTVEYFYEQSRS